MKSFFLYIHRALCGSDGVWKIGKTMTPYSAVRSRNRNFWNGFSIDHLFFGHPSSIDALEADLKTFFHEFSGTVLNKRNGQTELFKVDIDLVLAKIDELIALHGLQVAKVPMTEPYTAANSGDCPFGIPPESKSFEYLSNLVDEQMGVDTYVKPPKTDKNGFSAIASYKEHFQ